MFIESEQRKRWCFQCNTRFSDSKSNQLRSKRKRRKRKRRRWDGRYHVRDAISLCVSLDDFSSSLSFQGRSSLLDRDRASAMTDRSEREKKQGKMLKRMADDKLSCRCGMICDGILPGNGVSLLSPSYFSLLFLDRSIADISIHSSPRQIKRQRNKQTFITVPVIITVHENRGWIYYRFVLFRNETRAAETP